MLKVRSCVFVGLVVSFEYWDGDGLGEGFEGGGVDGDGTYAVCGDVDVAGLLVE